MKAFRIQELRLRHYRAFSDARLEVGDLTFLVGRNGAGKSTLMDALSFISEALSDSLGTALERRGSLEGIRQRQSGHGTPFEVSVAVRMTWRGNSHPFSTALNSALKGRIRATSSIRRSLRQGCLNMDLFVTEIRSLADSPNSNPRSIRSPFYFLRLPGKKCSGRPYFTS